MIMLFTAASYYYLNCDVIKHKLEGAGQGVKASTGE